ncbi:MAG: alpha/beta fold hydrolase [Desulfobacteraceae bacterium]|nr:alpha/beta fold hydrolase [Desulfobacteraceae bacterium]
MIEKQINGITFLTGTWPLSSDRPTLVFIHGAGDSSFFWKHQIKGLSDMINVIGIDLPGHGRSSSPGMASIAEYAGIVAGVMHDAQIPSPIPCGISMGGAITLQLLLDGKAGCKAGIVINSGAKLKVMPMIFDMIENDFPGYVNSIGAFAVSQKTDKRQMAFVIDGLSKTPPEVIGNDFKACNSFDVIERLEEISVPVLVMTADEDNLTPSKYGEFLAGNIKGAVHVGIRDAGHLSPVEKPDDVNAAIHNFTRDLATDNL